MGFITTALDLIPLPQDSFLAKAKKVINVGVKSYKATTWVDKRLNMSGKVANGVFNTVGPASKGFIDKVDKVVGLYHQVDSEKKLVDAGKKMLVKAINKLGGGPAVAPPVRVFEAGKLVGPAAVAGTTKPAGKAPSFNLPKHKTLHPVKLGKSLPFKPMTKNIVLGQKLKFSAATGAGFALNLKAPTIKFNAGTSKAFVLKTKAPAFNPMKSRAFTIKTLGTKAGPLTKAITIKPKISGPAFKHAIKPGFKMPAMPKTNFRPMPRPAPISRPFKSR